MKPLLSGAALFLLTACAGVRPDVPAGVAIVAPAAWRQGAVETGQVEGAWWRGFGDPGLSQVVEQALRANPDIAIAATRVMEARAQYDLSRAQLAPDLSLQAGGAHQRDLTAFGTPLTQNASRGELAISYDVDLFGRLSASSAAARAALLSSSAGQANVRLAVAATAATGYINLVALDARLAVLRQTLDARTASVRLAERRSAAGYSSDLELAQAQAEYQATAALIPSTEFAITRQENGVRALLGEILGKSYAEASPGLSAPATPVSLPSELLRRRPDIVGAENDLVAGERSLDAARAAFMPQIRLAASGGYVGADALPDNPVSVFSLGASVLAPIFDAGRLRAQADIAASRRDRAAYAYQRTVLQAFNEVENALAAVARTREQASALDAQREAFAHSLRLASNRYRAGYAPYLEELDAQRGLLSAELQMLQARTDELNAAVTLYQALGGGWIPS